MTLGFTLIIALIGYALFSPRVAGPGAPPVERHTSDASALRSSDIHHAGFSIEHTPTGGLAEVIASQPALADTRAAGLSALPLLATLPT